MIEINNITERKVNEKRLIEIFNSFSRKYNLKTENISLAIVPSEKMREANLIYRGKDKTTDVLTFCDLNEILIDPGKVFEQSQDSVKSFLEELEFVFVHALLHLVGFKDDTEEQRLAMIKEGEDFLSSLK
jgi:probable rRNA maturation factor